MPQEWFIDYGTWVDGPLSSRELADRAAGGRLRPTDRVSPDRERWRDAGKIKGLRFPEPTLQANNSLQSTSVLPPEEIVPDATDLPPTNPEPPVDVPELPGYQILGPLGFGGCGVVYKARQTKLDRVVALKTVRMTGRPDPKAAARFEKEAVSLARLQHPNIVNVFDSGRVDDTVFFAMELLKGEDLGQRISRLGRLDERTAWTVARQTAAALAHAAGEGLFHRDVKPANLFLVPMPTGFGFPADLPLVKVTDFGLAITRQEQETTGGDRLTAAGVVLGTPAYMAPEQFKSPDVDHRADIYALGATVYHALTGGPPFPGQTVWDVMTQKIQGIVPHPGPGVAPESADLIAQMLAGTPSGRVQSYDELIARIDQLPAMRGVIGGTGFSMPVVQFGRTASTAHITGVPSGTGVAPALPRLPSGLLATEFFTPPTGASSEAAPVPTSKKRSPLVLAGAVAAVAVVGGAIAVAALSGRGPAPAAAPPGPTEFVAGGFQESMLNPTNIAPWIRIGSQGVSTEADDEGLKVLLVPTGVRKAITPLAHYTLVIGFDLHEANGAEVTVCGPKDDVAGHPVVRVSRADGVFLGTRAKDGGDLTRVGEVVPFPSKDALGERRPYLEVRFTWAGGQWAAAFDGKPLGTVVDPKPPSDPELRIVTEGGAARVDQAFVQALVPKPAS